MSFACVCDVHALCLFIFARVCECVCAMCVHVCLCGWGGQRWMLEPS